jgi:eukaryotic-like serine/threonine-protein kinase
MGSSVAQDGSAPRQQRLEERFALEEELGRGGMGRVFAARDLKLDRRVAIKFLAPGPHDELQLRRFEQEARAAGALQHPNVLTVHDAGEHHGEPFIVTELLEGETVHSALSRGCMSATQAAGLALQLARGLAAAHEHGIVHRDLKPENLFVTNDGRLKILDFGIAQLPRMTDGKPRLTESGATVGTISYMSPEQVRGRHGDARSDLFSFGSVLHEMLAGAPPFERATPLGCGHAILDDPPGSLPDSVPSPVAHLVCWCLEKDPAKRPQSAQVLVRELAAIAEGKRPSALALLNRRRALPVLAYGLAAAALIFVAYANLGRRNRGASAPERNSVAVLPFVNIAQEAGTEYFADGMAEELINALANVKGLRVALRTSSFAYKRHAATVQQIGAELKVSAVVEGSVRRDGSRVRVTAQLVDATNGYHLWSAAYDRELTNLLALEDELARSIVHALAPRLLAEGSAPVNRGTSVPEAHDLFLKGRYFWTNRSADGLVRAIRYFEQAIALDPGYALAYAGLADATALQIVHIGTPVSEAVPKAKAAALRALELDANVAEAHAALGLIYSYEYDWPSAERELRRAIEMNPDYATAHQWYALLLVSLGRVDDAKAEAERARQLDPISPATHTASAIVFVAAREYDRAIERLRGTLEVNAEYAGAHHWLARAYIGKGDYAAAVAEYAIVRKINAKRIGTWLGELGYAYARLDRRADVQRIFAEMDERSYDASGRAKVYMGLGDRDRAFEWLDKAYADRAWQLREMTLHSLWDPLRSDPRFAALLTRMHLPVVLVAER